MELAASVQRKASPPPASRWHEVLAADGTPRPIFQKLLGDLADLASADMRVLDDRMEATLREMGVTFDVIRNDPWGRQPWTCDLLPHVFDSAEWELIVRGIRQRLRAFECFLRDVYDGREILRAGAVPIHAVLGSPHYQNAAVGLPRPRESFLHLSGICLSRDARGWWEVKHHHFSHATGISYMMQNRRALARVIPELFQDAPVQSLAEVPLIVLERLRETAAAFGGDPTVVLLSPGAGRSLSTEQSFLARRMGIPMVQGGDLLVLNDRVYLKTVRGLERVEVIYNRVADAWLDPLIFRRDSLLGVPGLVHCLRKGTVALVNAVGAQLADDRSLLAFAPQIIRFYLGEAPILPTTPTLWLGDIDQLELVLENLASYRVRPIFRENTSGSWDRVLPSDEASLRQEIRKFPAHYVAQPREEGATTICFERGRKVEYPQDLIVFAVRSGADFEVFPGALTRVHSHSEAAPGDFGFGWTSKDSWVLSDATTEPLLPALASRIPDAGLPSRQATSRVAESFYWMGRHLERAHHQAYLISIIETLETEELNSAERKHYRPMWNRLLPPLEKSAGTSRRSIANRLDRYRLVLLPEPGSIVSTFLRAVRNAESVQDGLSPEAWATISNLRTRFQRTRFREDLSETEAVRTTRRMVDFATQLIPQFFAVSANTMLADDGWRFCEMGQMLERAIITANSVVSISKALDWTPGAESLHGAEIELSAFLRLLGCRDAYRRIYQMRAEPIPALELLWQNPQVPRSVARCLTRCGDLLRESIAAELLSTSGAAIAIDTLIVRIQRIDWRAFVRSPQAEDQPAARRTAPGVSRQEDLEALLDALLGATLDVHDAISDSFLNHQARIAAASQPMLEGF
ncbi:MAG TPA: circularly permuted type 2 ATP-grasp protein [Chthoniobacteraceae bacterium]|nr:circularly permuted type 2 ATP-grasp protein [Chthoniobacteraceae bacterium]